MTLIAAEREPDRLFAPPRFPRLARLAFRALGVSPQLLDMAVMHDGSGVAVLCDRARQPKLRCIALYRVEPSTHLARVEIIT